MSSINESNASPEPTSSLFGARLPLLLLFSIVAWLVACMVSGIWLKFAVLVDAHDLDMASWHPGLGTYTMTSWFSAVPAAMASLALFFVALACVFVVGLSSIRSFFMFSVMMGMSVMLYMSTRMDVAFRVAVNDDAARVGCYIYDLRECQEMLGVQTSDKAPSRHIDGVNAEMVADNAQKVYDLGLSAYGNAQADSVAYLQRLRELHAGTAPSTWKFEAPGVWWLTLPLAAMNAESIDRKLQAQRQSLKALKQGAAS